MNADQKITHVLDRLSLGARPGDRAQVEKLGIEAYIQAQLTSADQPTSSELERRLSNLSTLSLTPLQLFGQVNLPQNPSEAQKEQAREQQRKAFKEAQRARLMRALESPHQLQEVMTDFWFNHFNIFAQNNFTQVWIGDYERSAIRPHALGKFRDLLGATAKHPAMLHYLNNWRNTAPGSPGARGPFRGLNENYARELMELHTLGINGGYTQADVETLARTLTGWSIVHPRQPTTAASGFVFAADRHDQTSKTLLGQPLSQTGLAEGEQALDILAAHPSTASHLSYKLAQFFVADEPPSSLVSYLSKRFLSTEGNIAKTLLALFESDEFWNSTHYQQKFKTPYQYILSMARAIEVTAPSEEVLTRIGGLISQLGMPLYRCRTPDGYKQTEVAWLSPDVMMRRVSMSMATANIIRDSKPNPDILLQTLENKLDANAHSIIANSPRPLQPALMLGSPSMMYR